MNHVVSKNGDRPSLTQVLESLSRRDLLQYLAYADRRKAHLERLQGLLQDRLARLMSGATDSTRDRGGELMTVADMAKVPD